MRIKVTCQSARNIFPPVVVCIHLLFRNEGFRKEHKLLPTLLERNVLHQNLIEPFYDAVILIEYLLHLQIQNRPYALLLNASSASSNKPFGMCVCVYLQSKSDESPPIFPKVEWLS